MSNCRTPVRNEVCYNDNGAPRTIWQHAVYNVLGQVTRYYYTDVDSTVILSDVTDADVTVGACNSCVLIVEGCIADPDGGTQEAYSGVNCETGALVWGPIAKDTLGYISCCGIIMASFCMEGYDYYEESEWQAGDTMNFEVFVDGVLQGSVDIDYTTVSDGVNKSSWYAPVNSIINSIPGWSVSVATDAPVNTSQRPIWSFEYEGEGASELTIVQGGVDTRVMTVNSDSTTATSATENGNPFGTNPFEVTC